MIIVSNRQQGGFTLIEIMVVVAIVAAISAMSLLSINQAFERRYTSEAQQLLIWLNQLSELSALQGSAYGIMAETDSDEEAPARLRAMVYYRFAWVAVSSPEPFVLGEDSSIDWLVDKVDEALLVPQQVTLHGETEEALSDEGEAEMLVPEIALFPDGYMEPEGKIKLSFTGSRKAYLFFWDHDKTQMLMERQQL